MGIDIHCGPSDEDHCEARWAYSGFMAFRKKVALAAGIVLDEMEGFVDNGKPWDKIFDPITLLLNHSDCDGELTPEQCAKVAPRLKTIMSDWPTGSMYEYDKFNGDRLVAGMEWCAENNSPLIFC